MNNPFSLQGYAGPTYFCDRERETAEILKQLNSGANITIFARRRLGKTGLILHTFNLLKKNKSIKTIYIDLLPTMCLQDMMESIANAIYKAHSSKLIKIKQFLAAMAGLRPVISFDEFTGNPEITLEVTDNGKAKVSLEKILEFLSKQSKETIIALDEFQQITQYPEENTEALLRSVIQNSDKVHFIFCGSDQKLMQEIFMDPKRPFYASTTNLNLGKISDQKYAEFIKYHFNSGKIKIDDEAILYILTFTLTHTYYTQKLCNTLFQKNLKKITTVEVKEAIIEILEQNSQFFYQVRAMLTIAQWKLLVAIAMETAVEKPYAAEFIKKHNLGTPAMVKRGITSLLKQEILHEEKLLNGQRICVSDVFLMRWLQIYG